MASNPNRKTFFRNYCYPSMISEGICEANSHQEVQSLNNEDTGLAPTPKMLDSSSYQNLILTHENNPELQDEAAGTSALIENDAILSNKNLSEDHLMDLETSQTTSWANVQVEKVLLPSTNEEELPCSSQADPLLSSTAEPVSFLHANKSSKASSGREIRLRRSEMFKYVDFLSDEEEPFPGSASSWEGTSESETENEDGSKKKRVINSGTVNEDFRKKKKPVNKAKERKAQRDRGEEYVSKKGTKVRARAMKVNPCVQKKCINGCDTITDERRQNIFQHYWSLSTDRRRDWLVSNSKKEHVKRKRTKDLSRRSATFNYFINEGEGKRQVCLRFMLNTLDLTQKFVHYTLSHASYGSAKEDLRGRHVPPNKTTSDLIDSVKTYIQNLPAVPSHYCRKNSTRFYLPQEFRNVTNLYRLYKEDYQKQGRDIVGEKVFKNIFSTDFNMGFHVPKKDKCVKCMKYQNDDSNNEEKIRHLKDKEETYERFKIHQKIHTNDASTLCVSFDLQKVLNTPHGESMLLYYSRKIAVYNLTFYECGTREGFCFTWTETDGKRGGNEVATILRRYIKMVDDRGSVKHLLLYSDSCPGQNRNKVILSCIHYCLQVCENLNTVQINYLLPGHTYMPVDSMHSVIEKSVSHNIIWAPSQWATVFSLARKNPKPYDIEVLTHTDFEGWDSVADKYFKGNLVGKISKVRIATFKKSTLSKIFLKYSMNTEAKTEEIEVCKTKELGPQKIYKAALPISKKKKKMRFG